MAKKKIYGPAGVAIVRDQRTAIDAPVSGAWTPDNRNANESGLTADDVTLDAGPYEDVRLFAVFNGSPAGAETVTVTPLMAVPDTGGTNGRRWLALAAVVLAPTLDHELISADGHDLAFRISTPTLSGATSVTLKVTGGAPRRGQAV